MTATATRPHRPIRTLAALLAGLCLATAAWAADYASLVGQARDLLQEDRIVEALAVAKDAVRANGNDYKGHYYVALAYLGMGRFDEADEAARRARALAPDSARAGVDKLVASIQSRRQGTGSLQAAEAALADGLAGKAARLYEAAWATGRDNPELGLKAADLYANRLNQPVDAGRVLRQVMQSAKGNPAADRAAGELRKLADTLKKIAQGHVAAAAKQQGEEARRSLQLAEEADPGYLPIYKARARLAAQGGDAGELMGAIKDMARRDAATPQTLAGLPGMAQWLQQPAMAEFLTDLLGHAQADKLRNLSRNQVTNTGAVFRDCDVCPEMVVIQGGSFDMGSEESNSEKPVHEVTLAPYTLARTEVTQGQWRALMGNNPSRFKDCGDDCPVENVNWNDAQDYLRRLSARTGKNYTLPSEAQWEYAYRAGTTTAFYTGDCINTSQANYDGNSDYNNCGAKTGVYRKSTLRVGSFAPNSFGLYDMAGNVWEWVQDCWNTSYNGAPSDGSAWASGNCGERVQRGGSWNLSPAYSRAALRVRNDTTYRFSGLGFRPARIISP